MLLSRMGGDLIVLMREIRGQELHEDTGVPALTGGELE